METTARLSGADGPLEELQIHEAVAADGEVGDLEALGLQRAARVQDALVVGLAGDYVLFFDP